MHTRMTTSYTSSLTTNRGLESFDTAISFRCLNFHLANSLNIKEQDRPPACEHFLVAYSYRGITT